MTTTVDIVAVEVPQSFNYEDVQDQRVRDWAMAAAGTIRSNISGAVQKVLEAGHLLQQAKKRLPHGVYLPWVDQACHLKPSYAQKLITAAEWVSNAEHVQHLVGVADCATLFLLSADATPEDVREWFMERAATGDVPTRAEVAERKRAAGRPRQPQPAEVIALSMLRKGELGRIREAVALAERAAVVTPAEVMEEQRLRDIGKLRLIAGMEADFHRMKDGNWIRLPHAGDVDVTPAAVVNVEPEQLPEPVEPVNDRPAWDAAPLLSMVAAANRLGISKTFLNALLTPAFAAKRNGGPLIRSGFRITREGRGMVRLTPDADPAS